MSDGDVKMCTHCPLCGTATDPVDFHVRSLTGGEQNIEWTYECLGCGGIEKTTKEWIELHLEKIAKTAPN